MLWITKAVYCQDYKIDLHFNDGKNGIVDLRDTILQDKRPIFQKLRDINPQALISKRWCMRRMG